MNGFDYGANGITFARKQDDGPVVSVIVPACGQVDLTRRCVEAVAKHTEVPWEVVLVDNGSTAEESAALRGLCDDVEATYLHFDGMIGYPAAINRGVEAARGECVCLMNNDAAFTGPWAKRLIGDLREADVVSPIVDQIAQPCQRLGMAPGCRSEVPMLFFVCVVMRRAFFQKMGGLDERFGLGNSEDVQFCEDVRARGGKLLVDPAVFVTHAGSATFLAVLGVDGYRKLIEDNRLLREDTLA
jgi:GT2 family glycosyltransferase